MPASGRLFSAADPKRGVRPRAVKSFLFMAERRRRALKASKIDHVHIQERLDRLLLCRTREPDQEAGLLVECRLRTDGRWWGEGPL